MIKTNSHLYPHTLFSVFLLMIIPTLFLSAPLAACADSAAQINREVDLALRKLYTESPAAKELSRIAKGILVFPSVVRGGLLIGGQYGKGALRKGEQTAGYYNTVSVSYGLQAGAQKLGYAFFFINEEALRYLQQTNGWEIGVGPNITIADVGLARSLSSLTAKEDIYAFFFDQKGLMAGIALEGTKITRIYTK
jgi:lipid-binding SYLF domain-containing protein